MKPGFAWIVSSAFVLGMLVAAPMAQGQMYNESLGTDAGAGITTGDYNLCIGDRSGQGMTSGSRSSFLGFGAGRWQTNDTDNTCIGYAACAGGTGDYVTMSEDDIISTYGSVPTPDGVDNTIIGSEAGLVNEATDCTFIGDQAGYSNTSGRDGTFIGAQSGFSNTEGDDNTFMGASSGYSNTIGEGNTFVGYSAGYANTTAEGNTAVGFEAGRDFSTSPNNTAMGIAALVNLDVGLCNTGLGAHSGGNTEDADFNTFVGFQAGLDNNLASSSAAGNSNTYVGAFTGITNRDGSYNVGMGASADFSQIDSSTIESACNNSYVGTDSWETPTRSGDDTDVSYATFIGAESYATGEASVTLGYDCTTTGTGAITIGATAESTHQEAITIGYGASSRASDTMVLGNDDTVSWDPNIDGVTALGISSYRFSDVVAKAHTAIGDEAGEAAMILSADLGTDLDDNWKLAAADSGDFTLSSYASEAWSAQLTIANTGDLTVLGNFSLNSDQRLKRKIRGFDGAMDMVDALLPVTFNWIPELGRNADLRFGFIAQDVREVIPELVSEADDGLLSVRYISFIPIFVRSVQELEVRVDRLRVQVVSLDEENALLHRQYQQQEEEFALLQQAAMGQEVLR
jgi:Chaperone of endosialidase